VTPKAWVIAGPTAAGKTALSLHVAEALGAEIVSADAMQVYRGMDIGTAKVSPAERALVPHHGLDVVGPTDPFDVADFLDIAHRVLRTERPVVVVGGTSLYLQHLRRGIAETPAPDPALRAELLQASGLFERLQACDPVLAARLDPADRVRVVRGVEVFLQTGRRLSELQAAHAASPDAVDVAGVWVDVPDLDARINARVHAMRDAGYVEEVRALLDSGVPRDAKPMRSLGYRHLADHVLDGRSLDDAFEATKRDTRRFARKQRTWRKHLALWDATTVDVVALASQHLLGG
jgi:tRNA dimethylallyltransferase